MVAAPLGPDETQQQKSPPAKLPAKKREIFFATCIPGLSEVLADEIRTVLPHLDPVEDVEVQGKSGVSFATTSAKDGLTALYWLRTAHRVLRLVGSTTVTSDDRADVTNKVDVTITDRHDLYEYIKSTVDVKALLGDGHGGMLNLSVKCLAGKSSSTSSSLPPDLRHLHYTALTVKNALVDACRDTHPDGVRPDVDTVDPDVPFYLALKGNNDGQGTADVSLYRSLNGFKASLHKRGYRSGDDAVHKAAMKESLAAGLLYAAGWDKLVASARRGEGPAVLADPMTGSGTLLTEAACMASDVAPGLLREKFHDNTLPPPALRWKDTSLHDWEDVRRDAVRRAQQGRQWLLHDDDDGSCRILGHEADPRALGLARRCVTRAGLDRAISLSHGNCRDWTDVHTVEGRTMIVTNPPWGKRLHDDDDGAGSVDDSWRALETFLKREGRGAEAWILSGNKSLTRLLRMKKTRSVPVHTGDEDLRWIQYHIFDWKRDGSFGDDRR